MIFRVPCFVLDFHLTLYHIDLSRFYAAALLIIGIKIRKYNNAVTSALKIIY